MLLSRVADALYWIGRYLERAEHVVATHRRPARPRPRSAARRAVAGISAGSMRAWAVAEPATAPTQPDGARRHADVRRWRTATRSIALRHRGARQRAAGARGNQLGHVGAAQRAVPASEGGARTAIWSARPHYLSRLVIEGVHLFQGITDATMGHGEGWQYLQVGRFLERADGDGRADRFPFPRRRRRRRPGGRRRSNGSAFCGRARRSRRTAAVYTADLRPERIAEFLLLNSEFPRSVRFAAASVESALRTVAGHTTRGLGRPRRAARRPPARVARLRTGRRDSQRQPARVSRRDRPSVRADPRGASSELHRCTRSNRRFRHDHESSTAVNPNERRPERDVLHHPPRHEIHLRLADQRERHGSAHAAAQRRRRSAACSFG